MSNIEIPYSVPMLPRDVPSDVALMVSCLEAVTDARFLYEIGRHIKGKPHTPSAAKFVLYRRI